MELITELVSVLAAQIKSSTQTPSIVPLRRFSIGGLPASPAVLDFFLDFAPPVFIVVFVFC